LTKEAAKYYQKSDKKTKRLLNKCFEDLKASPLNGHNIKILHGELVGLYRYRVTNLRVIYSVKEENVIVVVIAIDSRGDIYK
jgi:mRNA interferase RelE/StbE